MNQYMELHIIFIPYYMPCTMNYILFSMDYALSLDTMEHRLCLMHNASFTIYSIPCTLFNT